MNTAWTWYVTLSGLCLLFFAVILFGYQASVNLHNLDNGFNLNMLNAMSETEYVEIREDMLTIDASTLWNVSYSQSWKYLFIAVMGLLGLTLTNILTIMELLRVKQDGR